MKIIDALFQDPPKWWQVWNPQTGFIGGVMFALPAWLTLLMPPLVGFLVALAWVVVAMACLAYSFNKIDRSEREKP